MDTRIKELINGQSKPSNIYEETLVVSYKAGLENKSLLKTYFSLPDLENLTKNEFEAFILGFSYGVRLNKFAQVERNSLEQDQLN